MDNKKHYGIILPWNCAFCKNQTKLIWDIAKMKKWVNSIFWSYSLLKFNPTSENPLFDFLTKIKVPLWGFRGEINGEDDYEE